MQIENHVFLIAGGGSGLGAATAARLFSEGANVVIADVNDAGGWVAKQFGARGRFVHADVTDEAQVQAAVDLCASAFGGLHGAINCAGVAPGERVVGKAGPHSLASFERTVRINLVGTFNVIRLAAARMSTQPALPSGERGVIVNTSSVASFEGQIGQAAYAASKAGVNGMTLPIARELARFGIRVVTIAPGIFDTPMLQGMSEEIRASLGAQVPFPPRLGRPDEYAALVEHIVENEVLNGEVIRLDGAIRMAAK
jgi:NAD(P)-dependent dehydrogenase (short-subunit alcohol dehydrogenase family)